MLVYYKKIDLLISYYTHLLRYCSIMDQYIQDPNNGEKPQINIINIFMNNDNMGYPSYFYQGLIEKIHDGVVNSLGPTDLTKMFIKSLTNNNESYSKQTAKALMEILTYAKNNNKPSIQLTFGVVLSDNNEPIIKFYEGWSITKTILNSCAENNERIKMCDVLTDMVIKFLIQSITKDNVDVLKILYYGHSGPNSITTRDIIIKILSMLFTNENLKYNVGVVVCELFDKESDCNLKAKIGYFVGSNNDYFRNNFNGVIKSLVY